MSWAPHQWLHVWELGQQTGRQSRGCPGQRCGEIFGPHFPHSPPDDHQIRLLWHNTRGRSRERCVGGLQANTADKNGTPGPGGGDPGQRMVPRSASLQHVAGRWRGQVRGHGWREQRISAGGGWPRLWRGTGDTVVLAHRRPPAVASRGERLRRRGLPGPGQGVGNDGGG